MVIANYGDKAKFRHDPEHMSGNIGTAWVIADHFRKLLFAPVRADDPSLNRYLRNRLLPLGLYCSEDKGGVPNISGLFRAGQPDEILPASVVALRLTASRSRYSEHASRRSSQFAIPQSTSANWLIAHQGRAGW